VIIERIADDLGLPVKFVQTLARTASYEYKAYQIPKRGGGIRQIYHPSRRLKALQRWLLGNIVEQLPVHPAAAAYRKNQSIMDNAKRHVVSRFLLRMDIQQFFPSITEADIKKYIKQHPTAFSKWSSADVKAFCGIVCRHSKLTIGAPTSPALSNAICYDLDVKLQTISDQNNARYSRYADDLFFSTNHADVLFQLEEDVSAIIAGMTLPSRLKINASKTRHSSKRGCRRVTGIVLGSDGTPYIGRSLKRKIRALIYKYDTLDSESRSSLAGLISFATGFEPSFMNRLIDKYGLTAVQKAARAP
jgi:RNA-directed DNA polymerase